MKKYLMEMMRNGYKIIMNVGVIDEKLRNTLKEMMRNE